MPELILADRRADLVESRHRITAAVVDAGGRTVARAGDPSAMVFWRSTAKPFQLWPLVARGGAERFGLEAEHLALACASHNAEPQHRRVAAEWLARIGAAEDDLSCGGHPSLSTAVAEAMIRDGVEATPIWSNCSGKHAAMLALARLEGWPIAGYQRVDHPVQRAVAASISRWTGLPTDALQWGVDGCTAAAVATPLDRLAVAWARLGTSDDPAMATIRAAMLRHPGLIAGTGRLDTVLMEAWPGEVVVKVGAGGVYAAALPRLGVAIGLKVEDGDMRAAGIALVAVLERVVARLAAGAGWPVQSLARWREPEIRNTRGEVTGRSTIEGELHFA